MAWALVGSIAQQQNLSSAASLQLNLAQTATAGNTLRVCAAVNASTDPALGSASCTDSAGNTYTEHITVLDGIGHNRTSIFTARNITGSPTWVKITPSISSFITVEVGEYSGLDNAAAVQTSSTTRTTSSTATAGAVVPSNANSLCVMMMTHNGGASQTLTADTGNGYVERGHQTNTAATPLESQDASKSASTNPSVVIGGTAPTWIAVMAVFKPAAVTNNPPPRGLLVRPHQRHYADAWG